MFEQLCALVITLSCGAVAFAAEDEADSIAAQRMELMRARAASIRFRAQDAAFPEALEPEPLFRYDDHTRGYVDGTVWRLGKTGRPLAIITSELHPHYLGGGPRVVYDFLSLTDVPFTARSKDVPGWSPAESAVEFRMLPDGPVPAGNGARRLAQMRQLAERFTATQDVEGQKVPLRLLPKPIDRYAPGSAAAADGVLFLLVNGRNPGLMLLIETNGRDWSYGIGRLSLPSTLVAKLDDAVVYQQPPLTDYTWGSPYTASNSAADIPGETP
jgi:hypothetical protein